MITTPEQMREAAVQELIRIGLEIGVTGVPVIMLAAVNAIRAIPIAPQPVAVTVNPLVWVALGAGYMAHDPLFQTTALALSADYCAEYDAERAARILSALTIQTADPLSDPRVKALVEALNGCIAAIEHANMVDGVCCCGDNMEGHSEPMNCGHSPVDMGEYHAHRVLTAARTALSAIGGEA